MNTWVVLPLHPVFLLLPSMLCTGSEPPQPPSQCQEKPHLLDRARCLSREAGVAYDPRQVLPMQSPLITPDSHTDLRMTCQPKLSFLPFTVEDYEQFVWLKDGSTLEESNSCFRYSSDKSWPAPIACQVFDYPSSNGIYFCIAYNRNESRLISYFETSPIAVFPPKLHYSSRTCPSSLRVQLGEEVSLHCGSVSVSSLHGNQPRVEWKLPDGTQVPFVVRSEFSVEATLHVDSVTRKDLGTYELCAGNSGESCSPLLRVSLVLAKRPPLEPESYAHVFFVGSVVLITVGVLIFMAVIIIKWYYRYKKRANREAFEMSSMSARPLVAVQGMPMNEYTSMSMQDCRHVISCTEHTPLEGLIQAPVSYLVSRLKLPASRIDLYNGRIIGSGHFAHVIRANAVIDGTTREVAVKKLQDHGDLSETRQFYQEIEVMAEISQIPHENVLMLLGVCYGDMPLMAIFELCPRGNLREHLLKISPKRLSARLVSQLAEFALQIACGMDHISRRHFIHRDLAARNVLVSGSDDHLVLKIGDFGFARQVSESRGMYAKTNQTHMPVKWMAPESLDSVRSGGDSRVAVFTHKTDVWSYGVVLWEMFSLGCSPYQGMSHSQVAARVTSGHRLERPAGCPEQVQSLMSLCWQHDPDQRPAFAQIVATLRALCLRTHAMDTGYVNI